MKIRVRGHQLSLSAPLEAYAERRLRFALDGVAMHVADVDVRLTDVNGPRGGVDKACGIRAVLRPVGVVFARASGSDAYGTVDRAAARLGAALARRVGRRHAARRRS